MKPLGIVVFVFILLWIPFRLKSQEKDTLLINLPICEVLDTRHSTFAIGHSGSVFQKQILEQKLNQNLSDLLSENSGLYIRSYGSTGPSGISTRGSYQNHTAVLWNGFNIQDPLNGGLNVHQIPLFFTDEVEVISGGISALYGSGAIGGLIQLNNKANFDDKFSVDILYGKGSFSNNKAGINIHFSEKKYAGSIKAFSSLGKNNFSYINTAEFGKPKTILQHAQTKFNGFSQENNIQIGKEKLLRTFLLFQDYWREIPPTMNQSSSNKTQVDKSLRFGVHYAWSSNKSTYKLRTAILFSQMTYSDIDISLLSTHLSFSSISEFESKKNISEKTSIFYGFNNTLEKGNSTDLEQNCQRNRFSAFISYKTKVLKSLDISANLRQEIVNFKPTQPTFGVYAQTSPLKRVRISASVTRNYRVPTFNELFWQDNMAIGNKNLKDEKGFSEEFGMLYQLSRKNADNYLRLTAFNSTIYDLIQWNPIAGIWTPINQHKVISKGLETKLVYIFKIKTFEFTQKAIFTYTFSLLTTPDSEEIKKLLHSPTVSGNYILKLKYKKFEFEFNQNLIGKRLNSYIENDFQPLISLSNIGFYYRLDFKTHSVMTGIKCINLFNTSFQIMPSYPNPGRNFELFVRYKFNLKNNNS